MVQKSATGDGAATLMQRARGGVVALTLAKHMPALVLLLAPPAIWAFFEGQRVLATSLAVPAALALVIFVAVFRKPLPRDLRQIEALVSVALLFLLAPVSTLAAFQVLDLPPIDALFEGMSAITTTGLSVAPDPDNWPFAAHFLRSWMQWCGGLLMATAVLALILTPGLPARQLGRVGIDQGDRIASARQQARQLLGVYAGLTMVMVVFAMVVLPDMRDAFVLILSAISTGGFAPRSDSLASYSALGQGVVLLASVLGALSLLTIGLIAQGKFAAAWQLGSARRLGTALVLVCMLGLVASVLQNGWQGEDTARDLANLISGLTTAGFSSSAMPAGGPLVLVFVVAMLLGGDVGSTAGGVKLARFGTLARATVFALRAPRLPDRAVAPLRQNAKPVEERALISLLSLLLLYAVTAFCLWGLFLARGYPPLASLFDTISTLSTVGLSTGVVGSDMPSDLKLALTVAMWLGRLEFIAVLVLLLPGTWFRRRS